jgi:RNA polymerase sigma-70 factor (ECF subfamily)
MLKRTATPWLRARDERLAGAGGNQAGFAALLHRHRAAVVHFLYRMVQDGGIAEELAVEVFLRLYRSGIWIGPAGQCTTGLFRIATDLALKEPPKAKDQSAPEQSADGAEICRAVDCMPAKQRAAVVMHRYHRMDCGQISEVLNCSESAARSLLLSAYENLRRRVTPQAAADRDDCTA